MKYIKDRLGDGYVLIYKLHPWLNTVNITDDENIINGNNDGIRKLFSVTNYLICDYSAVIFDFSILEKPMIFYTPDLDEYKKDRGMYEEYEEIMPGPICKTEEEIVDIIKNNKFPIDKIKAFKDKHFDYKDGKSAQRVSEFIKNLI